MLVLVVFLFSRERISTVLENTGFDSVLNIFKQEEQNPEVKRIVPSEDTQEDNQPERELETEPEQKPEKEPQEISIQPEAEEPEGEEKIELPALDNQEEQEEEKDTPLVDKKLRTSVLYFVIVGDAGAISLQHVARPVYYTTAPLTRTMEALLEGLSPAELNKGMISLIPDQSSIRSVAVKEGAAHIDFTEDFTFNEFGAEGADAALKQVVYTATEFSSVDSVIVTIEGKKRNFLVSEGLPISGKLDRNSFE